MQPALKQTDAGKKERGKGKIFLSGMDLYV
jgi:hypothetical protein